MWVVHLWGGSWMDLRGSIIWPQWFGRDDIPPLYYLDNWMIVYYLCVYIYIYRYRYSICILHSFTPTNSLPSIGKWWKWISHDCPFYSWLGSILEVFIGTRLSAVWAELRVTAPLGLKKTAIDIKLQNCGYLSCQQDHGKTSQNCSKLFKTCHDHDHRNVFEFIIPQSYLFVLGLRSLVIP